MAIRVPEIDAAAAEVVIDLSGSAQIGIGPVLQATGLNAIEDSIELRFADQKSIVLRSDFPFRVEEVEAHIVLGCDHREGSESSGGRKSEQLRPESGGRRPFTGIHDRVIELYSHDGASSVEVTHPSTGSVELQVHLKSRGCSGK